MDCTNLCDFLQLCQFSMGVSVYKGQERTNVKTCNEFGVDSMFIVHNFMSILDQKSIRQKVDHGG